MMYENFNQLQSCVDLQTVKMHWTLAILNLLFLQSTYGINVGVGISDITGPAAEIGMMGYAKQGQNTKGIHIRQFSRAFIFEQDGERNVYVSADCGMMGQLVKMKVIQKLQEDLGSIYNAENVVLSATHTHSGAAGFLQYVLFEVSSLGFIEQTFNAMVDGIARSILMANKNIRPAKIFYTEGNIDNANINRSPTSYLANPIEERNMYEHDTDHSVHQMNIFHSETNEPMGVINWFAVHPTSMNNTNHLISGDNKGLASQLLEKYVNPIGQLSGTGPFVAAFASSNLGDVSPNIKGAKCIDTGKDCDLYQSTCEGRTQNCIAFGPGNTMKESTYIIGDRQFQEARRLFETSKRYGTEVQGPVRSINQWIDMSKRQVTLDDGSYGVTCPAAMGYSFAAGTTDGPGEFDFTQGANTTNPFWDFVSGLLKDPSPEQEACHAPKPILLDTGEMYFPYRWHPDIIDTQMLQVGNIIIAAVPGEFTTMAGRRLKRVLENTIFDVTQGSENLKVIVAGLSNAYTHYITTHEEYQRQRYEAASTIFGPHTLRAYLEQYAYLTEKMLNNEKVDNGTPPPNLENDQLSFVPGVLFDNPPVGYNFGDCLLQPPSISHKGDVVTVRFVAGHPRNDLMQDNTYLAVEKYNAASKSWTTVLRDNDWETEFEWIRTNTILGESEVEIRWFVPQNQESGTYRISHFGAHKTLLKGHIKYYSGVTNSFEITYPWIRRKLNTTPKRIRPNIFLHLSKVFNKTFFGRNKKH